MTSGSAYALRIPFTTLMKMNSNAGEREGGSLGHVSSVCLHMNLFIDDADADDDGDDDNRQQFKST